MNSSWLPVVIALLAVAVVARAQDECDCDDVPPTSEFSCQQQKDFGKCEESWLVDGGFCRLTCGKCSACGEAQKEGDANGQCDCPDVAPPGEFTCAQQAEWGKCGEGWIVSGGYCQGTCCSCPGAVEPAPAAPSSSGNCDCEDVQPIGDYTCAEQASWGKCEEDWMKSGGFCQSSCCTCQESSESATPGDDTCTCEDVQPPGEYTCAEQAGWGTCGEDWFVSGNYCAKTCGYCDCSQEEGPSPPEETPGPSVEDLNDDSSSDKVLFEAEEDLVIPQTEPLVPSPEMEVTPPVAVIPEPINTKIDTITEEEGGPETETSSDP